MLGSSYPGVAQFGSALEWGSRGREFDSRHSDQTVAEQSAQKTSNLQRFGVFFLHNGKNCVILKTVCNTF